MEPSDETPGGFLRLLKKLPACYFVLLLLICCNIFVRSFTQTPVFMDNAKNVRFWYADDFGNEWLISCNVQKLPKNPEDCISVPHGYEVEFVYAETIDGKATDQSELPNLTEIEYLAARSFSSNQLPRFFAFELEEAEDSVTWNGRALNDAEYAYEMAERDLRNARRMHNEAIKEVVRIKDILHNQNDNTRD